MHNVPYVLPRMKGGSVMVEKEQKMEFRNIESYSENELVIHAKDPINHESVFYITNTSQKPLKIEKIKRIPDRKSVV